MMHVWLFLGALLAFAFSTVAGGGGAMILLPLTSSLMGPDKAAPIIQLGNFVGRPTRLLLFWKHIHWRIVKWYLPLALIGAFLGAWLFSAMKIDWLQLVIGGFLVSTFWQFRFGKKKSSFPMKIQWFAPLGLGVAFLSSLVGATGPILNPFYMNYGVKKEELVATKAANSFFIAMVQLPTYAFFGALEGDMWWYGLSLGAGAAIGNWIGKKWLKRTSDLRFRQYLIWTMVIIGVIMIVKWFLN